MDRMVSGVSSQWKSWRRALLALALGAIGAVLARRLNIPGGAFTGAVVVTAVARLLNAPLAEPPARLRSAARIALGLTIGATITSQTLQAVGRALLPVAVMVSAMIVLGLLVAWALRRWTAMDTPTALCGSATGALAAMVALADDLGGDARVVASMHLVRLISVVLFIPPVVAKFIIGGASSAASTAGTALNADWWRLGILLVVGLIAGMLAVRFKVPAGDILASMAVAALLGPTWLGLDSLPVSWKLFAQWIIGAGVGTTVTRAVLRDYRPYALAGGLMTVFLLLAGLVLGWSLAQISSLDLATCIIGSAPGGADNMIILADGLGADMQMVTAMHVSRMVMVMLLLPVLARYAVKQPGAKAKVAVASVSSSSNPQIPS